MDRKTYIRMRDLMPKSDEDEINMDYKIDTLLDEGKPLKCENCHKLITNPTLATGMTGGSVYVSPVYTEEWPQYVFCNWDCCLKFSGCK